MHRLASGLLLALAFCSLAATQEDSSPAIAILDLVGVKCDIDTAYAVSEILRTEIGSTGAFRVIERSQLEKVLAEQQFNASGLVDPKDAARIGKLVGAKFVVIGSVSCLGSTYTVAARSIDVETAEMALGKTLTCSSEGALPEICRQLAKDFAGLLADPKVAVMDFMNAVKAGGTAKSWDLLSLARHNELEKEANDCKSLYSKNSNGWEAAQLLNGEGIWKNNGWNVIWGGSDYWSKNFGNVAFGKIPEKATSGKKPNVAISEATVDGSNASVKVKIGNKPEITVFLVNEGGWKIDSPITFTK